MIGYCVIDDQHGHADDDDGDYDRERVREWVGFISN